MQLITVILQQYLLVRFSSRQQVETRWCLYNTLVCRVCVGGCIAEYFPKIKLVCLLNRNLKKKKSVHMYSSRKHRQCSGGLFPEPLNKRQHDSDENIRMDVIQCIVNASKKELNNITEELLQCMKERTLDKKVSQTCYLAVLPVKKNCSALSGMLWKWSVYGGTVCLKFVFIGLGGQIQSLT